MGNHQSRRQGAFLHPEINHLRNADSMKPWEVIYSCSFSSWNKSEASLWGFDPMINYTTHCDNRLQPWTTRGRYLSAVIPAPETQDMDMSAVCMYATMAISEKKNKYMVQCINLPVSYFKERISFVELVASTQDFAIVQVATDRGRSDLHLVDMRNDKAKLIHTEACTDRPCLFECSVSHDLSRVLLKPNILYAQMHGIKDFDDVIKCVSIPRDAAHPTCYNLLEGGALEVTFTFDPRFRHSRIAMANMAKNDKIMLCTFDVVTRGYLNEREIPGSPRKYAQKLTFNPEGTFLAALMRLGPTSCNHPHYFCGVQIYTSDSLEVVHTIKQPDMTIEGYNQMTPVSIFPMFSVNGHFLCAGLGGMGFVDADYRPIINHVSMVAIHKVPPTLNLQQICRYQIRSLVVNREVKYLPLPDALKRFLLYLPLKV